MVGEEVVKKEKGRVHGEKSGEREKMVAIKGQGEPIQTESAKKTGKGKQKIGKMRGRRMKAARMKVDRNKDYAIEEALELSRSTHIGKFIGKIGANLLLSDNYSAQLELPYSTGEIRRVEVANEATLGKIEKGQIDFDVLLATPAMMPKLAKYAKLLGPRGLFPNPKNGTVVDNPEKVQSKFGGNNIKISTEKGSNIVHVVIGKTDQKVSELIANLQAVINQIPKKSGLKRVVVAASMGPGVKVKI